MFSIHDTCTETRKHENYVLGELILSTSKIAEEAKEDTQMWKETVLFYLIIVLQERN